MENFNIERPSSTAFIPRRLEVEGRPELQIFSRNILFASLVTIDNVDKAASALYIPVIETYQEDRQIQNLIYFNQFSEYDWINLIYKKASGRYEGDKYVRGNLKVRAQGENFSKFFIHLTSAGVFNAEGCQIHEL